MFDSEKPSPFLRWAGGKSWLVKFWDEITQNCNFNNYIEPFLGGGSIFFSISGEHRAFLSDINGELINSYKIVKEFPEKLMEILYTYKNNEKFYYKIRDSFPKTEIERAAVFIFLNHTSYNGLYRVNKSGRYNVPYGNRKSVMFSENKFFKASNALRNTILEEKDFMNSLQYINEGDLVFLDPPYTVSHNNNGFIEYNKNLFSLEDQYRLSYFIDQVKIKNAYYILTNAAHSTIKEIFDKNDTIYELKRNSMIGGKNSSRGIVSEYVFTNIKNEVKK